MSSNKESTLLLSTQAGSDSTSCPFNSWIPSLSHWFKTTFRTLIIVLQNSYPQSTVPRAVCWRVVMMEMILKHLHPSTKESILSCHSLNQSSSREIRRSWLISASTSIDGLHEVRSKASTAPLMTNSPGEHRRKCLFLSSKTTTAKICLLSLFFFRLIKLCCVKPPQCNTTHSTSAAREDF